MRSVSPSFVRSSTQARAWYVRLPATCLPYSSSTE